MAKNESTVAVRAKRSKTPAQVAKAAKNIEAYNARCAEQKRNQLAVNHARKFLGMTGSDKDILAKLTAMAVQEARHAAEVKATSYIESVLAIPRVGEIVQRWLDKQELNWGPVEIQLHISNFLNREKNSQLLLEAYPYLVFHEVQLKAAA